jgi:hypothetical protein
MTYDDEDRTQIDRVRIEGFEVKLQPWEEEFGLRINELFWEYFDKSEDPEGWNRRWVIQRYRPNRLMKIWLD